MHQAGSPGVIIPLESVDDGNRTIGRAVINMRNLEDPGCSHVQNNGHLVFRGIEQKVSALTDDYRTQPGSCRNMQAAKEADGSNAFTPLSVTVIFAERLRD